MNKFNFKSVKPEQLKNSIEKHGYAIVEDVLNNADLVELNYQIRSFTEMMQPKIKSEFLGSNTIRFGRLLWRLPKTKELVNHSLVRNVLDQVLLQHAPTYHLSFTGVMHLKEGQKAQVLHRDNTIFENTESTPINLIATMWAAEDFTKENGATVIVPGSHQWNESRVPQKDELVIAEMPAGSVLFYAGNLIHGAGNCKVGTRTGVAVQYNLGWMTQEEPQFLATPPEFAAKNFDEDLLRLIGYDTISRNNGEIDSEHLLDFLLQDGKERGLANPGYEYTNGKCKSLFLTTGNIRTADHHYDVTVDDL